MTWREGSGEAETSSDRINPWIAAQRRHFRPGQQERDALRLPCRRLRQRFEGSVAISKSRVDNRCAIRKPLIVCCQFCSIQSAACFDIGVGTVVRHPCCRWIVRVVER